MDAESVAVGCLVTLGALPLLRWVRLLAVRIMLLLTVLGSTTLAMASWKATVPPPLLEHEVQSRPIIVRSDGYAGADACFACHPSQHASWSASYHRTMTQVATPETVLAPFDGRVLEDQGRRVRVSRVGDRFWAEIDDREHPGQRVQRAIVVTTGSHSEQFYWYAAGSGRKLGLLGFVWRIAEQRWIPYLDVTVSPNDGHGRLSPAVGTWNRGCMYCHTTRPRMRFDPVARVFDTQVDAFGIACEACHGPGAAHVAANRDPIRRYGLYFSDEPDPTIVNPAHLSPRRASQVCGQCHGILPFRHPGQDVSTLNAEGLAYRPGDELEATRPLMQPSLESQPPWVERILRENPDYLRNRFWSDGVVRVSGREYNGLVDSPCFQGGEHEGELSCLSCHELHQRPDDPRPANVWADDQLTVDAQGDATCLRCHQHLRERVAAHSNHAESSPGSRCVNCHMPLTTFGLLRAIRSHTIESPDVQVSLDSGRPNGCNLCHLDRSLAWTADRLARWYGIARPELSPGESALPASWIWALSGDAGQRAVLAASFGWGPARETSDPTWHGAVLARLLDDPYHAVRFVAERSLRSLPEFAAFQYDSRGPAAERVQAVERALQVWDRAHGAAGHERLRQISSSAEDGGEPEDAMLALRADRDDRPIVLQE